MREQIIKRIGELFERHGEPSSGSMRWACVFQFVCEHLGMEVSTKKGKQLLREMKLKDIDYSTFSDEKLLEFFELVVRRVNVCM